MIKLVLAIVFFIGSILTGFYFVYPEYLKYQTQLTKNEALEQELENTILYLSELKDTDRKISENEEVFEKLKTSFPEDHDAPSLYLYIIKLIDKHNLENQGELGSFSVQPHRVGNENHQRIKRVTFSLSLEGRYSDIKNFLRETERLVRIISIDDFSVDGDEERRDYVGITFNAITYSY